MALSRFGVSCSSELLDKFDTLIRSEGYATRSDAIGALMRKHLMENKATGSNEAIGTVIIEYDHHKRELSNRLLELQHAHHDKFVSSMHIHLTHDTCLEVIVLRAPAETVQKIGDAIISTRGVLAGNLVITSIAEE